MSLGVHLVVCHCSFHPVMHLAFWFVGDMQRVLPHASSTTGAGFWAASYHDVLYSVKSEPKSLFLS